MHRTIFLAFFLTLVACGGEPPLPDPGPSSGLDPNQPVNALSTTEWAELCDWAAGRFGGYGRSITCADGNRIGAQSSKDACVSDYARLGPSCTLTVDDVQSCINGAVEPTPCQHVPGECFQILFCATP